MYNFKPSSVAVPNDVVIEDVVDGRVQVRILPGYRQIWFIFSSPSAFLTGIMRQTIMVFSFVFELFAAFLIKNLLSGFVVLVSEVIYYIENSARVTVILPLVQLLREGQVDIQSPLKGYNGKLVV